MPTLLRISDVATMSSLSTKTIARLLAAGHFGEPVRIGAHRANPSRMCNRVDRKPLPAEMLGTVGRVLLVHPIDTDCNGRNTYAARINLLTRASRYTECPVCLLVQLLRRGLFKIM